MSLSSFKAISVIPVPSLDEGLAFYRDKLGFRSVRTSEYEILFECGLGTYIQIYVSPSGADPGTATRVTWEVAHLDIEMRSLQDAGVDSFTNVAEDDDFNRAVWFQDPFGNWLCLHELNS